MKKYIIPFLLGCLITAALLLGSNQFFYNRNSENIPPLNEAASLFITNKDNKLVRTKEILQSSALPETFDVRFVVYTGELARKFALNPDYITTDLTPGMLSLAIGVKTVANHTECQVDTFIDNSLPLDYPEQPILGTVVGDTGLIMLSPAPPPDPIMHDYEIRKSEIIGRYSRDIYFTDASYDPNHLTRPMIMFQGSFKFIDKNWWPGIAWFSITPFDCDKGFVDFLKLPNPTLWIKKKDGDNYSYRLHLKPNDFIKFSIPYRLIKEILPTIKQASQLQKKE